MDALIKATQALVEARNELRKGNMTLQWDLKIGYNNYAEQDEAISLSRLPEYNARCGRSEK